MPGPTPIEDDTPKFPAQEVLIKKWLNLSQEDVSGLISEWEDVDVVALFFATFYRPPSDERDDSVLADEMEITEVLDTIRRAYSPSACDSIRTAILGRTDMKATDLMQIAAANFPTALSWFWAKGYLTERRSQRANTKLLIDLCSVARSASIAALAALLGYAVKDAATAEERIDILVCMHTLGSSEVLGGMESFEKYHVPAQRRIMTVGPAVAVREMVNYYFPPVTHPVTEWDHGLVLAFVTEANQLVKQKKMAPDVRKSIADILRDVHIHALLLKDADVVRQTSMWIASSDFVESTIRSVVFEPAVASGDPLDPPEESSDETPESIMRRALAAGKIRKVTGKVSVERGFEAYGLTPDIIRKESYAHAKMQAIVAVCWDMLVGEGRAIHPGASKFVLSFLEDYMRHFRKTKRAGPDDVLGLTSQQMEKWDKAMFRRQYFKKTVGSVAHDLDQTPMEHLCALATSGDVSSAGGAHMFACLAKYFGVDVLTQKWIGPKDRAYLTRLMAVYRQARRDVVSPAMAVFDDFAAMITRLDPAVLSLVPASNEAVCWLINPTRMAAVPYILDWAENTDAWYTGEILDTIDEVLAGPSSTDGSDPWSNAIRRVAEKRQRLAQDSAKTE